MMLHKNKKREKEGRQIINDVIKFVENTGKTLNKTYKNDENLNENNGMCEREKYLEHFKESFPRRGREKEKERVKGKNALSGEREKKDTQSLNLFTN